MNDPNHSITPDREAWLEGYRRGYGESQHGHASNSSPNWNFSKQAGYLAGYNAGLQHPDSVERRLLDNQTHPQPGA